MFKKVSPARPQALPALYNTLEFLCEGFPFYSLYRTPGACWVEDHSGLSPYEAHTKTVPPSQGTA